MRHNKNSRNELNKYSEQIDFHIAMDIEAENLNLSLKYFVVTQPGSLGSLQAQHSNSSHSKVLVSTAALLPNYKFPSQNEKLQFVGK